jgi:hypothetical protein
VEATSARVGLVVGQRSIGTARRLNDFYAEFPITLSFESTPGQLVTFLSELRAAAKFTNVRAMQVTPVQPVMEAPKNADLTKNLRVTLTVAVLAAADLVKK